jgi:hypothetical protein
LFQAGALVLPVAAYLRIFLSLSVKILDCLLQFLAKAVTVLRSLFAFLAQFVACLDGLGELARQFVQFAPHNVQSRTFIHQSRFQISDPAFRLGDYSGRRRCVALFRQLGLQFGNLRLPARQRRFQTGNTAGLSGVDPRRNRGGVLPFDSDDETEQKAGDANQNNRKGYGVE